MYINNEHSLISSQRIHGIHDLHSWWRNRFFSACCQLGIPGFRREAFEGISMAHPRTRDGPGGGKICWDCVSLIFVGDFGSFSDQFDRGNFVGHILDCFGMFGVPANPRIMNVDFVFSFLGFWRVRTARNITLSPRTSFNMVPTWCFWNESGLRGTRKPRNHCDFQKHEYGGFLK